MQGGDRNFAEGSRGDIHEASTAFGVLCHFYRFWPTSAVMLKLHEGNTVFVADQNPTLSLLGSLLWVTQPVTWLP